MSLHPLQFAICLLAIGCVGSTPTPAGLLAEGAVAVPKGGPPVPEKLTTHQETVEVCGSDDFGRAELTLTWRGFHVGADSYVVDVSGAIARPGPNLAMEMTVDPIGKSTLDLSAWHGLAVVDFRCKRMAYKGCKRHEEDLADSIQLLGDGTIRRMQ